MDRFILIIIAVVIIFSLITYLLYRLTFKKKYIKYLLPVFTLLLAIYYLYQSRLPSQGFEDIASILMVLILFAGFLSSTISGLFFDFILPKIKKK